MLQLGGGENVSHYDFALQRQPLYTVVFQVLRPDGSQAPEQLGVAIKGVEKDALSYQLAQNRRDQGVYSAGYVPPGSYDVLTYMRPDVDANGRLKVSDEVLNLQMAKQRITVTGDTAVTLVVSRREK